MAACSLETLQAIRLKVVEASPDAMIVINRLEKSSTATKKQNFCLVTRAATCLENQSNN